MRSVLRGWAVAQNAPVTLLAMAVAGLLVTAFGSRWVPGVGQAQLPLALLMPPVLAVAASLGVTSRLPQLNGTRRLKILRGAWLAVVAAVAWLGAGLLAASYPGAGIVAASVALTVVTYGAATLVGQAAGLVGVGALVVVLGDVRRFADSTYPAWTLAWRWQVAVLVLVVISGVAFVLRGSASDTRLA